MHFEHIACLFVTTTDEYQTLDGPLENVKLIGGYLRELSARSTITTPRVDLSTRPSRPENPSSPARSIVMSWLAASTNAS
jgi:hypothetical protein